MLNYIINIKAFEEMIKSYEKCKKIVEKEGHFKQYIRALAELEIFINDVSFYNDIMYC
jgi:hypothetical protein